eukprot:TRINITY_DN42928_c0_g1_i1.p2 TRINITY_DN42928_c0_g1~~TRINITY_DN42928_c0_g1_i1.p2  ORF type:complete len:337 (+),score=92.95 TRINITY_DN42928_c0_g1_i1:64-1074(+)
MAGAQHDALGFVVVDSVAHAARCPPPPDAWLVGPVQCRRCAALGVRAGDGHYAALRAVLAEPDLLRRCRPPAHGAVSDMEAAVGGGVCSSHRGGAATTAACLRVLAAYCVRNPAVRYSAELEYVVALLVSAVAEDAALALLAHAAEHAVPELADMRTGLPRISAALPEGCRPALGSLFGAPPLPSVTALHCWSRILASRRPDSAVAECAMAVRSCCAGADAFEAGCAGVYPSELEQALKDVTAPAVPERRLAADEGILPWQPPLFARAVWVPDSEAPQCLLCKRDFRWWRRRHHCRACGNVVCGSCTRHRFALPAAGYRTAERVCTMCGPEVGDVP